MPSIQEIKQKCKSKEVYTSLVIIFVGFASFAVGKFSFLVEGQRGIQIEPSRAENNVAEVVTTLHQKSNFSPAPSSGEVPAEIKSGGLLVGSLAGRKYHFPWCAGAQRISEKNKIWFNSVGEAQKAGYTPAANCKGLK